MRELNALDCTGAARIVRTLEEQIAESDDTGAPGAAVPGGPCPVLARRIGGYRVIARIKDERVTVLLRVAHRREVHR